MPKSVGTVDVPINLHRLPRKLSYHPSSTVQYGVQYLAKRALEAHPVRIIILVIASHTRATGPMYYVHTCATCQSGPCCREYNAHRRPFHIYVCTYVCVKYSVGKLEYFRSSGAPRHQHMPSTYKVRGGPLSLIRVLLTQRLASSSSSSASASRLHGIAYGVQST